MQTKEFCAEFSVMWRSVAVTMSDDEVENARPTSEELPDDEKDAEGNSVREEDLIRDYDAEEEELVQQSADEDIE